MKTGINSLESGNPSISQVSYILAAQEGDLITVKNYFEAGGDLMATMNWGYFGPSGSFYILNTALHVAAAYNRIEVMAFLIGKGVPVNLKTQTGWTPLHVSTFKGHRDAAVFLVNHGADISVLDEDFLTAIHIAYNAGNGELARELIDLYSSRNTTASVASSLASSAATITYSYDSSKMSAPKISGEEYILAAQTGDLDKVKRYINEGGDIKYRTDITDYNTPFGPARIISTTALHEAAANNKEEVIKFLLEQEQMPIDVRTKAGWTPLHAATFKGHRNAATLLVMSGADITARDRDGYTPLDGARNTGYGGLARDLEEIFTSRKLNINTASNRI